MGTEFDPNAVKGIVTRACERKLGLFVHFPEYGLLDLVQEGLIAAARAHSRYDPSRSAYSTWIYRAASSRCIDIWRWRERRAAREAAAARPDVWTAPGEPDTADIGPWLREILRAAQGACGKPKERRGRKWYSPPQSIAMAALSRRLGLSTTGLRQYLQDHGEVALALRLRHVPSRAQVHRMVVYGVGWLPQEVK